MLAVNMKPYSIAEFKNRFDRDVRRKLFKEGKAFFIDTSYGKLLIALAGFTPAVDPCAICGYNKSDVRHYITAIEPEGHAKVYQICKYCCWAVLQMNPEGEK